MALFAAHAFSHTRASWDSSLRSSYDSKEEKEPEPTETKKETVKKQESKEVQVKPEIREIEVDASFDGEESKAYIM